MEPNSNSRLDANPYAAPEMSSEVLTGLETAAPPIAFWKLLLGVIVIEIVATTTMICVHGFAPHIGGMNTFAVGHMIFNVLVAMAIGCALARRPAEVMYLLLPQIVNLFIWVVTSIVINLNWPGSFHREGWIFLVLFAIGAMLTLISSLLSHARVNRRRNNHSRTQ